jgi:NADH-quinone oxidoreductase subunit G
VKRILSRNHPDVDGGWLCDKGRFTYSHLNAHDRITTPLRRVRRRGFEEISWDDALDEAEAMLRRAGNRIVTALSGSETVELAYGLGKLLRQGLGAHAAVLPEETREALDAFRLPLSAIASAQLVVVVGDEPVDERAPIVGLWIRAARRNGARLQHGLEDLDTAGAERIVLIWSGDEPDGCEQLTRLAHELGLAGKDGSGAFYLPRTANGRGAADGWAAASDEEAENPEPIGLLIVSGDEAAADANVRALAEHAEAVLASTMFHGLTVGWADLVLPGTSYLERDGTYINLEGRVQRLRRAVIAPGPDELAWIARLAQRFDVELSPYPSVVFDELSAKLDDGLRYVQAAEQAPLPPRAPLAEPAPPVEVRAKEPAGGGGLRLVRYKPLFSGPAVERVPELEFQRPGAELEISPADAAARAIPRGARVVVRSNGTSVELRARFNRRLRPGTVRAPRDYVEELSQQVEVAPL